MAHLRLLDVSTHLEVVDGDPGDAASRVDIQDQQVDIGLAGIELGAPLRPKHADLAFEPQHGLVDRQRLPECRAAIGIAMQERRERAACLRVAGSRQNDSRHQLDTRRIGFDPDGGRPFRDDGRRVNGVGDMDSAALSMAYLQELAALSRPRALEAALVRDNLGLAIRLGETPTRVRPLEVLDGVRPDR